MINILHISDIHFGTKSDAIKYRIQLETDLRKELDIIKVDYLVISGDTGTYSIPDEYHAALDFVDGIANRFDIERNNIIIVPGNHDVNWDISEDSYVFTPRRKLPDPLPEGKYIDPGDIGVLIRNDDLYKKRFCHFSRHFYKPITGMPYPMDFADQGIIYPSYQNRILFLGLNSCWQIDHYFKNRSGIHTQALFKALASLEEYREWLKIAIFHHPVTGPEIMRHTDFMEQLTVQGFQVIIHGHVHEAKQGFYAYDSDRGIHVIGAGTFGAPTQEQAAGIPLQYNLLKYDPKKWTITVETRRKEKPSGAWYADARWGNKNNPRPRYIIDLRFDKNDEKTKIYYHTIHAASDSINIKSHGDVAFAKDTGLININRSSTGKVFISYSPQDTKIAEILYHDLKKEGVEPWMAETDLRPGQNRRNAIYNAIKNSKFFIAMLSKNSLSSQDRYNKELKIALETLAEFPTSDHFVIPVRIDDCDIVNPILSDIRSADLFPSYENGLHEVLRAIASEKLIHPGLKSFWSFLSKIGFEKGTVFESGDFIVLPDNMFWKNRFGQGVYVSYFNNDSALDRELVNRIYQKSKAHTKHAILYTNQKLTLDGRKAMTNLRLSNSEPYVLIPVNDIVIKEALVSRNEAREFANHTDKYMGSGYNPFDVRDPVYDDLTNFFGREGIIEELSNELTSGKRLGLFGLHKIGKSSVLKYLQKKLEFPVAYCYLRSSMSLDAIYQTILKSWQNEIRIKYPNINWKMNIDHFEDSVNILLNHLTDAAPVPHLAIFLDEIENIIPYREGDNASLERYVHLMETLRGLQQETDCISLLVAGVHPTLARVNFFWGNQKNPMHQVIIQKFLHPLEKNECDLMIRSLGQEIGIDFDNKTIEFIIKKSGGHPYIARQLCSTAYSVNKKPGIIPMDVVSTVAKEFVYNPSKNDYFNDYALWGELGKADIWGAEVSATNHRILLDLSSHYDGLSKNDLFHNANRLTFEQALYGLIERSIISLIPGTERYEITIELFQDWIRVNKLS